MCNKREKVEGRITVAGFIKLKLFIQQDVIILSFSGNISVVKCLLETAECDIDIQVA